MFGSPPSSPNGRSEVVVRRRLGINKLKEEGSVVDHVLFPTAHCPRSAVNAEGLLPKTFLMLTL